MSKNKVNSLSEDALDNVSGGNSFLKIGWVDGLTDEQNQKLERARMANDGGAEYARLRNEYGLMSPDESMDYKFRRGRYNNPIFWR